MPIKNDIHARDAGGRNALYFAIKNKNTAHAAHLIENGISLQVAPHMHVLFHAIYCDDFGSVKTLIEKGINPNIRNRESKTPLMCAAYYGRVDICCYLIHHGANLFLMDQNFDMAIDLAYHTDKNHVADILNWRMLYEESKEKGA